MKLSKIGVVGKIDRGTHCRNMVSFPAGTGTGPFADGAGCDTLDCSENRRALSLYLVIAATRHVDQPDSHERTNLAFGARPADTLSRAQRRLPRDLADNDAVRDNRAVRTLLCEDSMCGQLPTFESEARVRVTGLCVCFEPTANSRTPRTQTCLLSPARPFVNCHLQIRCNDTLLLRPSVSSARHRQAPRKRHAFEEGHGAIATL